MTDTLTQRILDLIPSEGLKRKLRETGFIPADSELLSLAFNYAPDFDTRLGLLRELETEFADEYAAYIKRLVEEQLATLERFKKPEPGVVFELHIKEEPDSFDERYLCGSYEAALRLIPLFFKEYGSVEREFTRYRIVKRKVYCGREDEAFDEDELGEMELLPGRVISSVDLWALHLSAECCRGECFKCGLPCARNWELVFPCFIRHGDAVKWREQSGRVGYGIVLQREDAPCEAYYVIPLDSEAVLLRDFDNVHDAHTHILAPLAERIDADELPEKLRAGYFAFREYLKTNDDHYPKLED